MTESLKDPAYRALVDAFATRPNKQPSSVITEQDFLHILGRITPVIAADARREALEEARTLCKAIVRAYDDEAHEKFKRPGEFIAGAKSSAAEECEGVIRALMSAPEDGA